MTSRAVAVIGAGWAGVACARTLTDAGRNVDVFERASVVGGHSRAEVMGGVVYEPNGPHIFHTNDEEVAAFVTRFGMQRPYEHRVRTLIHVDDGQDPVLLAWPPQVDELRALSIWPAIEHELALRPKRPSGESFEDHAISLMGPTLYRLFIHGYTTKQWGRDPRELSSSFAPKRIDLRTDGDDRLFRDRYQFLESNGFNEIIERIGASATIHLEATVGITDIEDLSPTYDAFVVTAPLDDFVGRPDELAWRGISMRSTLHRTERRDGTVTAAYQVNYPDLRYPFTRTIETKHATGQRIGATVVSQELPGAPQRHYPVPTLDNQYEYRNWELKREIIDASPAPVHFCGRLANYAYINQDQAIRQGIDCARRVLNPEGSG